MTLNQSDISALSEALRELYANTDIVSLPCCIVRLLHQLIRADSAVYNSFDFRTGQMQVVHDHGPDGDRYLPALQKHVQEHPLMVYIRAHWQDGAESLSNVISRRQLRHTGIYSEFLNPLGIEEQIGLLVEDRVYGVTAVGLQREGRNFSSRDKAVLTFLQPHLMQAYKNASDLALIKIRASLIESAANTSNLAVVWLSRHQKVEWMSNRAEFYLREYFKDGLHVNSLRGIQLPQSLKEWIQEQAANGLLKPGLGWRAEQTISGRGGRLNILWIYEEEGRSYLILSEQKPNEPMELLSLGLTAREAEVLHWIAEGKTNETISILLTISKRTVDKHVERILEKLAVENRVEAVLRVRTHRQHG